MRVLFINPNRKELVSRQGKLINRPWPPLDLLNCAGLLEENRISAEILDLRAKNLPVETVKRKMEEADLCFITSSPIDRWQCPNPEIEDLLAFINSLEHKEKIYALGVHATLYPEEILKRTDIKGVVRGQPESAVLSICQNKSVSRVIGPIEVDLDRLPLPAYDKIDLNDYHYELMGGRLALLETGRGCPYQCAFCLKVMYGEKIKRKNIQKVKQEIDYVVGKLRAGNLYFIDLEFTLERSRVEEICKHIIQKGYRFNWCCQTRADAVDHELLKLMRRSGCTLIHYGVESGSQRVLGTINKKISAEKIEEGFALTRKAGIATAGFFMFGFPEETEAEMKETISFAREINPDYASFHAAIPYPGTKLVEGKGGQGMFPDINLSSYPREFISKLVKQAYLEFYFRPKHILSTLFRPKLLLNQVKLFYNFIK
jgi:anaerobic magnesium-protoporphyrin IX monomethyl ester cyclase